MEEDKTFDETYKKTEEMFGHPYQELQDYFSKIKKGSVLDIGCGQGRDSIFLSSIGYELTAVDNSKVGISQMLEKDPKIKGIVADVLTLELTQKFDIILFDMILHSFGKQQQIELLKKYSNNLKNDGSFCIVFPDDMNTSYFMDILDSFNNWKLKEEIIIKDTPKIDDKDYAFVMIIVSLSK